MGIVYYFLLYSSNLSFILIPDQADVGTAGVFGKYLESSIYIDKEHFLYFNYPIFFQFHAIIQKVLGLERIQVVNIGFFILLLSFPVALSLLLKVNHNENQYKLYYYFPIIYILITFFFINSQFVPQFLGLLFLIFLTGSYTQLEYTKK
jgi:hypothetical protein